MIGAVVYGAGSVSEHSGTSRDALRAAKEAEGTTWVQAADADPEELDRVAAAFGIHPLAVEDVRSNVRAKTETFASYTFVLAKAAELTSGDRPFDEEVRDDTVGVFVGEDWVVTMTTTRVAAVDRVWRSVVDRDERLLERGPDFTAYRVIDRLVDAYFDLLDAIETQIETIEEEVLESTEIETLERINDVRRDLLSFRKVAWPMREAVGVVSRGDASHVQPATEKYYRDVYDHLVQVVDLTETYRDLARGSRDIYQNTVAQSTNEVMKVLTVVATIFIPLTFVAGVYGMNFETMPELGWEYAYYAVMAGMTAIGLLMLAYFRRQGYL